MSLVIRLGILAIVLIIGYLGYRRASGGCGTCPSGYKCNIPILTGDSFCYCGSENVKECGNDKICKNDACVVPTPADLGGCPILGAEYTGAKDISFTKCGDDQQCTLCDEKFECITAVNEEGNTTYPCPKTSSTDE